jgi:hypothetical protein
MLYVVVNKVTGKAHCAKHGFTKRYDTQSVAQGIRTKLNKAALNGEQWELELYETYCARPVKMVERRNALTGELFMEAEDTPYFCSPSSETYWSS